jgi:hypothetical protein
MNREGAKSAKEEEKKIGNLRLGRESYRHFSLAAVPVLESIPSLIAEVR